MAEIKNLFLAIFALYRLASLISSEEGPYIGWPKSHLQTGIFKAIRIKLGVVPSNVDPDTGLYKTNLARGVSCPLCTGMYISVFLVILLKKRTRIGDLVLLWLGLAGSQVFLVNNTDDDALKGAIEEVAESLED